MLQCGALACAQDKVTCFMDPHPALHVDLMLVEHLQGLFGLGATRRALLSAQIEPADDDVVQVAIRQAA
jgi:hypothetical protein